MKLGKFKLSWPQATVVAVGLAAVVAVFALASPDQRTLMLEGVGAIWLAAATLLPSLVSKHDDESD